MIDIFDPLKKAPVEIQENISNLDFDNDTVIIDGVVKVVVQNPVTKNIFVVEEPGFSDSIVK